MNETAMSAEQPTTTPPAAGMARRSLPSGLRRTIGAIVLSAGLFAIGGVAVVSAASPDPSATAAPSGTTTPGGTTAPGGAGGTHTAGDCPGM